MSYSTPLHILKCALLSASLLFIIGCDEYSSYDTTAPTKPTVFFNLKRFEFVANKDNAPTGGLCISACVNMWENYWVQMGAMSSADLVPIDELATRKNGTVEAAYWIHQVLEGVTPESNTWSGLTQHIHYRIYPAESHGEYNGMPDLSMVAVCGPDYTRVKSSKQSHAVLVTNVVYSNSNNSSTGKPVMVEVLDSNSPGGKNTYGIYDMKQWSTWLKNDIADNVNGALGYMKGGQGYDPFPSVVI